MVLNPSINLLLVLGAAMSAVAALLHYLCIFAGAPAFKALGAGERFVTLAARGNAYPAFVAFLIGSVLTVCAAYALSGAGLLFPLPWLRWVLLMYSGVLLVRAVAFPLLRRVIRGNSTTFWWTSSALCFAIGAVHAIGLQQVWTRL